MTIAEYRRTKGLTQPQLAEELKAVAEGIDAPLISKMEKGICEPTEAVKSYINTPSEKMTQTERVLNYIKRFGSISTWDAFRDLGVTRLSARIAEIKKMGYEVETNYQSGKNRFGQTVSWARYSFKEGKNGGEKDVRKNNH